MYSYPQWPLPHRRRPHIALRTTTVISLLVVLASLLTPTLAYKRIPYEEYSSPELRRFAALGAIDFDPRSPPPRPGILRRQDNEASDSTSRPSSTTASELATADASSSKETQTGGPTGDIETASSGTSSPTALPSPFDTSLGSNFTAESCPEFFNTFLNDENFKECHPISLLLETSNSFFQASGSEEGLSKSLDAACGVSLAQCSPLMTSLASEIVQDSNCGQDYRAGNPIVDHARAGLVAYEPLYRATCLKNKKSGNRCFADAASNTDNLSEAFTYYLALGTELPAASRPACDQCLIDVMDIFAGYADNQEQPISGTYSSAAQQMNVGCGPDFINTTIPASVSEAVSTLQHTSFPSAAFFPLIAAFSLASIAF